MDKTEERLLQDIRDADYARDNPDLIDKVGAVVLVVAFCGLMVGFACEIPGCMERWNRTGNWHPNASVNQPQPPSKAHQDILVHPNGEVWVTDDRQTARQLNGPGKSRPLTPTELRTLAKADP